MHFSHPQDFPGSQQRRKQQTAPIQELNFPFPSSPLQHKMLLPSHWNASDKCTYVDVHSDGVIAGYNGPGKSENDAAAVRANCPIPSNCGVFYWEVQIVSKGRDGHIGIGVCSGTFPLSRLPGWDSNSIGYHGDDGFCFVGTGGHGIPFGPRFTSGDVIGCGVDFVRGDIFFTKNGIYLGAPARIETVFKGCNLSSPSNAAAADQSQIALFPVIGFRTPGEVIKGNFSSEAFAFNLSQYCSRLKFCQRRMIERHCISHVEFPYAEFSLKCIILEYLISEACWKTAQAFWKEAFEAAGYAKALEAPLVTPQTRMTCKEVPTEKQLQQQLHLVKKRKSLMEAVLAGDLQSIIPELEQTYPQILAKNRNLAFRLHCQQFIQLIQSQKTEKMLEFGKFLAQEYQQPNSGNHQHQNDPLEYHNCLNSLFAIVGYPKNLQTQQHLQASSQASLCTITRLLNRIILREYERRPSIARLQRLFQQTQATLKELEPFI